MRQDAGRPGSGGVYLAGVTLPSTWTGLGSPDPNWSNPANWSNSRPPTQGDDLLFPAVASGLSNYNDLNLSVRNIEFTGTGYSIFGNALTLVGEITDRGDNQLDLLDRRGALQIGRTNQRI